MTLSPGNTLTTVQSAADDTPTPVNIPISNNISTPRPTINTTRFNPLGYNFPTDIVYTGRILNKNATPDMRHAANMDLCHLKGLSFDDCRRFFLSASYTITPISNNIHRRRRSSTRRSSTRRSSTRRSSIRRLTTTRVRLEATRRHLFLEFHYSRYLNN